MGTSVGGFYGMTTGACKICKCSSTVLCIIALQSLDHSIVISTIYLMYGRTTRTGILRE